MNYQDYLSDALELVAAWEIPDEDFAEAVIDQAKLMAGISPDGTWDSHSTLSCALL